MEDPALLKAIKDCATKKALKKYITRFFVVVGGIIGLVVIVFLMNWWVIFLGYDSY